MKRFFSAVILIITIVALYSTTFAQPKPDHAIVQDGVGFLTLTEEGDTLPASWYSPAYIFSMVHDSAHRTHFTFTECKKNGSLLKLLTWNHGTRVHEAAELISFNSRTENFAVKPGDTISFYRELAWINAITSQMLLSNYYSLDTLEMIVYLVNVIDGSPLARLDSIGILPCLTPGMPRIYGERPIMALVSYVVPPSIDADSALVGITVRAQGAGQYHFIRADQVAIGLSNRLNQAEWLEYLAAYSPAYSKRSIDELTRTSGDEGALLQVSSTPGSPRDLRITFTGPRNAGRTTIAIYDEVGSLVFYPYDYRTDETESETSYRVPGIGAYFVTLAHNGKIVKTQKTIITR